MMEITMHETQTIRSWVLDLHDEEKNLIKIINHIAGAHFDKIYLMAAELLSLNMQHTLRHHLIYSFASFTSLYGSLCARFIC